MHLNPRDFVIAAISIVLVVAFCFIVVYETVAGKPYTMPDAFLAVVISVVSYFFGQHAATNGAYAAGDAAASAAASTLAQTKEANAAKVAGPPSAGL